MISVTFQSKGRSGRRWVEYFDLGSDMENGRKAVEVAWKKNATIVAEPEQLQLLDPAEELAAAKATPGGAELSPAAQALYEQEGAARFAEHHRRTP